MSKITRADKIRSLSDVALADLIQTYYENAEEINFCHGRQECEDDLDNDRTIPRERCRECLLDFLRQPAED